MNVFYKKKSLQDFLTSLHDNISIGFVPTMGALHKGHLSLIKKSRAENDCIVVSIFVNPTQFDNKDDLLKYPKNVEKDIAFLEKSGCDVVFIPDTNEVYNKKIKASVFDFDGLEFEMEGKHRKGHFDGVGTIVKKFLEIVKPHKAYFGEKDFQQLQIVKKLVQKQELPVEIIACSIYREEDGLAMSSRNVRLTDLQRKEAPFIYKTLKNAKIKFKKNTIQEVINWVEEQFKKNTILELEYFEIAHIQTLKSANYKNNITNYRAFIAVFAGGVRLIDNIALN